MKFNFLLNLPCWIFVGKATSRPQITENLPRRNSFPTKVLLNSHEASDPNRNDVNPSSQLQKIRDKLFWCPAIRKIWLSNNKKRRLLQYPSMVHQMEDHWESIASIILKWTGNFIKTQNHLDTCSPSLSHVTKNVGRQLQHVANRQCKARRAATFSVWIIRSEPWCIKNDQSIQTQRKTAVKCLGGKQHCGQTNLAVVPVFEQNVTSWWMFRKFPLY